MGSDTLYSPPSAKKPYKGLQPEKYVKNKTSLILLVGTVLILQVADYGVVWLAGAGSTNSSFCSQVDIFVGIFVLFYVGKRLANKFKEPSDNITEETEEKEEEEEEDEAKYQETTYSTTAYAKGLKPIPRAYTKYQEEDEEKSGTSKPRRVSFNSHVDKVEPWHKKAAVQSSDAAFAFAKSSALRADAPEFVSQRTESLRAEAPEFVPKGSKVVAPWRGASTKDAKKDVKKDSEDGDDVGEILFRGAHSAAIEKKACKNAFPAETAKPMLKADYDPWAYQKPSLKKAEAHTKWQVKEAVIWKSSHVVAA